MCKDVVIYSHREQENKQQEERKMKNINKAMYEKVMATPDKVYCTKMYQYWINGNGELCRARLSDLDTTAMLDSGAIEKLD